MMKNLSIVAGIVLMAGCAHVSVSDSQRTTSVAFDGLWHGEINGTRQQQSAGSWELQCGKVNLNVVTQVDSGVISGYLRENENITFTTNLDDGGGFYAKVAKESSYREAPSSDISMTGKEYFVFRGRLDASSDSGKGQFVLASTQMGMGGCMTPIRFVRS
jgi:hypothetical protein